MAEVEAHWSRATEAGTLLGIRFLLLMYRVLGRRGFRCFLYPVMAYFYLARPAARRASQNYLSRMRALQPCDQGKPLPTFRHLMMFGEILLDKLLVWMGDIGRDDVVFDDRSQFEKLEGQKRGGVIVVSHLGNTEVCSALAHQMPNIRLTLLVYTQHAVKFNAMLQKANPASSIDMVQVTDMTPALAMLLSERVEDGEFVVIAGDRTPVTGGEKRASKVDFLGSPAAFPQGAFILASLLKCPVYLMFCIKQSTRYHLYLEAFTKRLEWNRRGRDQGLEQAVQAYAHRLGDYCQKAPLQWFNFFDFWGDDN